MPEKKKSPTKKSVSKKSAKKTSKPSAAGFSLDDALSVAKTRDKENKIVAAKKAAKEKAQKEVIESQQAEKRVLGAASLADILGGIGTSETKAKAKVNHRERTVDAKLKKFHDVLIELYEHVQSGLNKHTEDTLKRSSKDDSGDLSSYSQHMADAGTETFDRDFALSMVSSEQDALQEIEAALDRIYDGTYGICEMTGKRIRDERLMAVPFTRHSIASQTQIEKNKTRSAQRGGIFSEATSEDSIAYDEDSE